MWQERWLNLVAPFDEPTSRLYHVNIMMSVVLVLGWAYLRSSGFQQGRLRWAQVRRYLKVLIFNRGYWWNASTRVDFALFFFNGLLKSLLYIPFLQLALFLARSIYANLGEWVEPWRQAQVSQWALLGVAALVFIFDDALRFGHHLLMHKVPLFWRWHRVHHNATTLTPITLYRTHPIESLMGALRNTMSLGIISGVFISFYAMPLTMWTLLGVNGFGFVFNFFAANLRHSQIPISFGWLEYLIISPKQHQAHHAQEPAYYEKNYGVTLAIWDGLNRSLLISSQMKKTKMTFGNLT